jgi:hypothetical protein
VHTGSPLDVSVSGATLTGTVAAGGARTTYYFEYGRGGALAKHTRRSPSHELCGRVTVRVRVDGLAGDSDYGFRLVARNHLGNSYGTTVAFATAPSSAARHSATPSGPNAGARRRAPTIGTGSSAPAPQRQVLWGAEIGPQLTGTAAPWDMNAVTAFQDVVGKAPSIVAFNIPFEACSPTCNYYPFPATQLAAIRSYGAIPMLNWASMSSPLAVAEPSFRLANVAAGDFDAYIRSFALAAKAWGHPFFLRFDWEMNGNWFPWAQSANGNQPGDFVAAWRHVHEIFTSVGASNATWVWCPTSDPNHEFTNLSELYPGNAYVDWTCLDGYNYPSPGGHGWSSFDQIYSSTYDQIVDDIAPGKPFMVGEVASSEQGGSKAAWVTDMLGDITSGYSALRAFVWFDWSQGGDDWPIETSSASAAAFAQGIAAPLFTTNTFGNLGPGTIEAPT